MGFRDSPIAVQNTTLVTTAETLILASTLPIPMGPADEFLPGGSGLYIDFKASMVAGTSTTGVTVRFRRGFGTGGAIDGEMQNMAVVVGSHSLVHFVGGVQIQWLLQPGGGQYSITLQQVAATANGTIDWACASLYTVS